MEVISKEEVHSVLGCIWSQEGTRRYFVNVGDRQVVEKIEECVGRFVVGSSFRCVTENFEWAFVGVYGPNDDM